jgi:hypothetical protein
MAGSKKILVSRQQSFLSFRRRLVYLCMCAICTSSVHLPHVRRLYWTVNLKAVKVVNLMINPLHVASGCQMYETLSYNLLPYFYSSFATQQHYIPALQIDNHLCSCHSGNSGLAAETN